MDSVIQQAWQRLELLGEISDEPGVLTREFGGPGMERASALLTQWMDEAGLITERDGWGNVFGQTPVSDRPRVVLGSHFDTVRNAGRFDGPLGILAAMACVELLRDRWDILPFQLEVAAFSDEEGARFQSAYLGSRAAIGAISEEDLLRGDSRGIFLRELIPSGHQEPIPRYTPDSLLAYLEIHIEQGPVLEHHNLPVGVVTDIAGQTRM
ncbi:MAG: M20/M25/M40 family metallo-hydrolase, partial [Terrimicrobiaceae bacterium]